MGGRVRVGWISDRMLLSRHTQSSMYIPHHLQPFLQVGPAFFLSKILREVKNFKHKRDVLMWKLS